MCGYCSGFQACALPAGLRTEPKTPHAKRWKSVTADSQIRADTEAALFLFDETVAEYLTWIFLDSLRTVRVVQSEQTIARPEEETQLAVWFSEQCEEFGLVCSVSAAGRLSPGAGVWKSRRG